MFKAPKARFAAAAVATAALTMGAVSVAQTTANAKPGGVKGASTAQSAALWTDQGVGVVNSFVTFKATYPSSTQSPYVVLTCVQGGKQIYRTGAPLTYTFWLTTDAVEWVADGTGGYCTGELIDIRFNGAQPTVIATAVFELTD